MKTLKKLMVVLVASVMAFGSYLALPFAKIVAHVKAEQSNEAVQVKKVPSHLNLENSASVEIPFNESYFVSTSGKATVRVYNGTNRVVAEYNADSTNYLFTPTTAGNYSIVYGYVDSNEVFHRVSSGYPLTVVGKVTTLTLEENTEFYLPSKLPAKDNQKVIIPYPTVVLNDGTKLNHGDEGYVVDVKVSNKSEDDITLHESTDGTNVYKYFELNNSSVLGKYQVRYQYGQTIMIKNFEVVNKDNFDTSKLSYTSTLSSWTESAIRYKGEEITLPTVTVKDSSANDVTNQTFNKITVKYVENGVEKANENNSLYKLDGNKITLYKNAKTDGSCYYEINYNIKDYFGNAVKTYKFKINNVSSYRNTPKGYAVDTYKNGEEIRVIDYKIPSTFNYIEGNEETDTLKIPAIYAEDSYGSTEFTYKRTLKIEGESTTIDIASLNFTDDEVATYKIEKTGIYTLTYTATSVLTGKAYSKDYKIKVVDGSTGSSESVNSTPEIKLANVPTMVKAGETVDIELPTVTDKDSTNTVIDERLELIHSANLTPVYENYVLKGYTFTAPTDGTTTATITVTAKNDNGKTAEVTKTIEILTEDLNAPVYQVNGSVVVSDDIVTLPTVTFTDENLKYAEMFVTVYDPNGNIVTGVKNVLVNNGVISGGSFVAGLSGVYNIVYTAIDPYSNATSVLFLTEEIKGTSQYIQTGLDGAFPTQIEVNEKVTLPNAIVELNGEVSDVEAQLKLVSASGAGYKFTSAREFTATEEGEFVFVYVVNGEEISSRYTLSVKDTKKPELNIYDYRPSTVISFSKDQTITVNIPAFNPSDNTSVITDWGVKITKNGSKFKEYTGKDLIEEFYKTTNNPTVYSFIPNENGVYVVEYYAIDAAGNKATQKLDEIHVGDTDSPEIKINANIPTTVNKGEIVSFNKNEIVVVDTSNNATYEVKVTGPNNEIVNSTSDDKYAYKLTSAGDYTITITADDGFGHTTTETRTVKVSEEEYEAKINTDVLGIVLIVVSLVILGGVVFYFIKTRDRKPKIEKETIKD